MDAREIIAVGMSAERIITVRPDLTVKHFVPKMPAVFATPMMIMEMEMASAHAIAPHLAEGWVTVGTEVDIRHLGASAVGAIVRTTARVIAVERRVIRFEVEAYEGDRKIGDGRHARGLVNVANFEKRFAAGSCHTHRRHPEVRAKRASKDSSESRPILRDAAQERGSSG